MKAISARVASAVHRAFRRTGAVLHGRCRRGFAPAVRLDEASSGRWFEGWRREPGGRAPQADEVREVGRPRTWLLSTGWRRHGLIDPAGVPGR